eukprot:25893-Alexandrium_andersonii.AAC.1
MWYNPIRPATIWGERRAVAFHGPEPSPGQPDGRRHTLLSGKPWVNNAFASFAVRYLPAPHESPSALYR